ALSPRPLVSSPPNQLPVRLPPHGQLDRPSRDLAETGLAAAATTATLRGPDTATAAAGERQRSHREGAAVREPEVAGGGGGGVQLPADGLPQGLSYGRAAQEPDPGEGGTAAVRRNPLLLLHHQRGGGGVARLRPGGRPPL